MDNVDKKIQEAYEKDVLGIGTRDKVDESGFIDDSKVADAIFKELEIAANDMIMKKIIPEMKKVETAIQKKYKTTADSTMFVKNLGSAFIHDVLRQLLGQSLLSVSGSLKKIKR